MLTSPGFKQVLNIGERNIAAAKEGLQAAGLQIKGEAVGGNSGRTVKLYVVNGLITVKTLGQGETVLC
jgi:chemotaxis receptor (MCP) glutamine deamidase CheD